jgi:hypothetical protein
MTNLFEVVMFRLEYILPEKIELAITDELLIVNNTLWQNLHSQLLEQQSFF